MNKNIYYTTASSKFASLVKEINVGNRCQIKIIDEHVFLKALEKANAKLREITKSE